MRRNRNRFQAKPLKKNGKIVNYQIYMVSPKTGELELFLTSPLKLTRPNAYAIATLLTSEADGTMKWADKFQDPYPDNV